jgi:ribonucleoside-diphosphate reductase alpha chain
VATAIRFLDNVLTVNNYPLAEIKEQAHNIRRVGLGITGLHDMLLKLGLKYNSSAGLEFVDKVMDKIKNWAYEASCDLAAEKGAFPKFDPDQYLKGGFAKTLKPSIREKIREQGIRNCAVLTVAPVGTGSMVCDTSSGIEPMFAPAYKRKFRDGDKLKEEVVIHPLFKKFMDEGRSVKHFQGAHDLKLKDHFEMQRVVQKHIDNAVSKTINIPHAIKEHELSELYMEYFPELKGVTVYPEGSRENQPLTPMDIDEAIKAYKNNAESGAAVEDKCKSGVCEL